MLTGTVAVGGLCLQMAAWAVCGYHRHFAVAVCVCGGWAAAWSIINPHAFLLLVLLCSWGAWCGCLVARLWLCVRVFFILPRSVSGAMALVQPMAFIPLTFDWVRLKDPTSGRVYYSSECVYAEPKLWQLRRSRTALQIHRVFLLDEAIRVWLATKGRRYHRFGVLRERGVRAPRARLIALRVL